MNLRRTGPWSSRMENGYFIVTKNDNLPLKKEILDASQDKDRIFDKCDELKAKGIDCWVEDSKETKLTRS